MLPASWLRRPKRPITPSEDQPGSPPLAFRTLKRNIERRVTDPAPDLQVTSSQERVERLEIPVRSRTDEHAPEDEIFYDRGPRFRNRKRSPVNYGEVHDQPVQLENKLSQRSVFQPAQRSQPYHTSRISKPPINARRPYQSITYGNNPTVMFRVEAVSFNQSDEPDDLEFPVGQVIDVMRQEDSNWLYGKYRDAYGQIWEGIFPSRHVRRLTSDDTISDTRQLDPGILQTSDTKHQGLTQNSSCGDSCILRQIASVELDARHPEPVSISNAQSVQKDLQDGAYSIFGELNTWQTRLIRLKSKSVSNRLECDLLRADLIDGPGCGISGTSEVVEYEALSYSWGTSMNWSRIWVNGTRWAVSDELASALLHLKLENKDRYLWCDALCINQLNTVEKAAQIKSLLRIFEKATGTIAWLGSPHISSGRLVKAFEWISSENDLLSQNHEEVCGSVVEGLAAALRQHLASKWFFRTWIRQEVFSAKELKLYFGRHCMDFELFNSKLDTVHALCNPDKTSRFHRQIRKPTTLDILQREYQHFGTDRHDFQAPNQQREFAEHWLEILSHGPLFAVTEERDRVYGCLGILTSLCTRFFARLPGRIDTLVQEFPVSYEGDKKLGEVFGDIIKFLVNVTGMANALDFWRLAETKRTQCDSLASWAVDWTYFDGVLLPSSSRKSNHYDRTGCVKQPKQDFDQRNILHLRGLKITTAFKQLKVLKTNPQIAGDGNAFHEDAFLQDIERGLETSTINTWFEEVGDHYEQHGTSFAITDFPALVDGILKGHYCLAEAEGSIMGMAHPSTFLVSRNTQLDDCVVSFYGSEYLHLIRPSRTSKPQYTYIGPVLPFTYKVKTSFHRPQKSGETEPHTLLGINKDTASRAGFAAELFELL